MFDVLRTAEEMAYVTSASQTSIHIPTCVFIGFFYSRSAATTFGNEVEGILGVRNYHLQRTLVHSVCESIIGLHHIIQGEVMRNELFGLKLP
jgi:hypothetical protein